jgi:hypothetical protein
MEHPAHFVPMEIRTWSEWPLDLAVPVSSIPRGGIDRGLICFIGSLCLRHSEARNHFFHVKRIDWLCIHFSVYWKLLKTDPLS